MSTKTTTLIVDCEHCHKKNCRVVNVYHPDVFSKKGTKSIMSQFWCDHCKKINAVRYQFAVSMNGNIVAQVKCRVEPIDFIPEKPPTSITVKPKASSHRPKMSSYLED